MGFSSDKQRCMQKSEACCKKGVPLLDDLNIFPKDLANEDNLLFSNYADSTLALITAEARGAEIYDTDMLSLPQLFLPKSYCSFVQNRATSCSGALLLPHTTPRLANSQTTDGAVQFAVWQDAAVQSPESCCLQALRRTTSCILALRNKTSLRYITSLCLHVGPNDRLEAHGSSSLQKTRSWFDPSEKPGRPLSPPPQLTRPRREHCP